MAKAEELANWDFIKASERVEDFRDHLARFAQGVSERWARARLEGLVWAALSRPVDAEASKGFLAEFPNGVHASEANAKLVELEVQAAARGTTQRDKSDMDAGTSVGVAGSAPSFSKRLALSYFFLREVPPRLRSAWVPARRSAITRSARSLGTRTSSCQLRSRRTAGRAIRQLR